MALQRLSRGSGPESGSGKKPESCALSKSYPTVCEFLSSVTWPDGSPRVTGTITLLCELGTLKAALNDRDASASAFVSANSFTTLLKAIEAGLSDGSLDWRLKEASGGRSPGRRG